MNHGSVSVLLLGERESGLSFLPDGNRRTAGADVGSRVRQTRA